MAGTGRDATPVKFPIPTLSSNIPLMKIIRENLMFFFNNEHISSDYVEQHCYKFDYKTKNKRTAHFLIFGELRTLLFS